MFPLPYRVVGGVGALLGLPNTCLFSVALVESSTGLIGFHDTCTPSLFDFDTLLLDVRSGFDPSALVGIFYCFCLFALLHE